MAVHTYITPQQVRDRMMSGSQDRLADLLNLPAGQDPLASVQLTRAIEDSAAEVESFVRARYSLPFAIIPPELTTIAYDVVRYRLLQSRPDLITDVDRLSYQDALRALRDIADGRRQLLWPPENQTESLSKVTQVEIGARAGGQTGELRRVLGAF